MEKKQKILEYRARLEKILASPHLLDEESIKNLVKNQLLHSSPSNIDAYNENIAEKRAMEVSNFLEMLRSASKNDNQVLKTHGTSHINWKLKEDNEEYRVMYREGAQGTPFHTLLVEGYANAPLDVCLCASWEAYLYKKWWPQIKIPPFRVSESICLQKVQIGEQIGLVRLKLPWPLSDREVILNYFELECFEDGLIIVLLHSISDMENIDKWTQGFTNEAKDMVRAKDIVQIDLVGGYAIKKIDSKQSYFRTIATMDIKLDFVPPSLINFISRQLIGGACKLYQKTVASVSKGDEDFEKALEDPLYVRTREYLYPVNDMAPEPKALHSDNSILHPKLVISNTSVSDKTSLSNNHSIETAQADTLVECHKSLGEIFEEDIEHDSQIEVIDENMDHPSNNPTVEQFLANKEKPYMSPEVEGALGILENAIYMVQRGGFSNQAYSGFGSSYQDRQENIMGSTSLENVVCSDEENCLQAPKMGNMAWDAGDNSNAVHPFRLTGPLSTSREVYCNGIAPSSPEQNSEKVISTSNRTTEAPMSNKMTKDYKQARSEKKSRQKKKQRLSCPHFLSLCL